MTTNRSTNFLTASLVGAIATGSVPQPATAAKADSVKRPNVVVILIDDMGFGVSDAFGGMINMPNMTKLANNGLRYNRFHTTALCAPTRMALLTG